MRSVTFQQQDERLASARLRSIIPMRELSRRGWVGGNDIIVLAKHGWAWNDKIKAQHSAVVFDVCDDHFDNIWVGQHYRHVCSVADAVTCNSPAMRDRILEQTGVEAVVVDDPYEHDEQPPGAGDMGVLWFGNKKGLPELYEHVDRIEHPVFIVTDVDADWCIRWSPGAQAAALEACGCVFVPPTRMLCRSANRAVTAIRAGRMVVAGDIPAYREIPGIFVSDDFVGNLDTAMSEDMRDNVAEAQAYVRDRFSPERIADQWEAVFKKVLNK